MERTIPETSTRQWWYYVDNAPGPLNVGPFVSRDAAATLLAVNRALSKKPPPRFAPCHCGLIIGQCTCTSDHFFNPSKRSPGYPEH